MLYLWFQYFNGTNFGLFLISSLNVETLGNSIGILLTLTTVVSFPEPRSCSPSATVLAIKRPFFAFFFFFLIGADNGIEGISGDDLGEIGSGVLDDGFVSGFDIGVITISVSSVSSAEEGFSEIKQLKQHLKSQ